MRPSMHLRLSDGLGSPSYISAKSGSPTYIAAMDWQVRRAFLTGVFNVSDGYGTQS